MVSASSPTLVFSESRLTLACRPWPGVGEDKGHALGTGLISPFSFGPNTTIFIERLRDEDAWQRYSPNGLLAPFLLSEHGFAVIAENERFDLPPPEGARRRQRQLHSSAVAEKTKDHLASQTHECRRIPTQT